LAEQLRRLPGYPQAEPAFRESVSEERWKGLDTFEQLVIGPLRTLGSQAGPSVRSVIDGFDQLAEAARDSMHVAFDRLTSSVSSGTKRQSVLVPLRDLRTD